MNAQATHGAFLKVAAVHDMARWGEAKAKDNHHVSSSKLPAAYVVCMI